MATHTLGTNANTSLTAVTYHGAYAGLAQADLASINAAILNDQNPRHLAAQLSGMGGFVREGLLYVPNRGVLRILEGDVVAVDETTNVGWPILVSKQAIASGAWHYV